MLDVELFLTLNYTMFYLKKTLALKLIFPYKQYFLLNNNLDYLHKLDIINIEILKRRMLAVTD